MVDEDPITLFEKLRGQHNNFLLESVEAVSVGLNFLFLDLIVPIQLKCLMTLSPLPMTKDSKR